MGDFSNILSACGSTCTRLMYAVEELLVPWRAHCPGGEKTRKYLVEVRLDNHSAVEVQEAVGVVHSRSRGPLEDTDRREKVVDHRSKVLLDLAAGKRMVVLRLEEAAAGTATAAELVDAERAAVEEEHLGGDAQVLLHAGQVEGIHWRCWGTDNAGQGEDIPGRGPLKAVRSHGSQSKVKLQRQPWFLWGLPGLSANLNSSTVVLSPRNGVARGSLFDSGRRPCYVCSRQNERSSTGQEPRQKSSRTRVGVLSDLFWRLRLAARFIGQWRSNSFSLRST